MHIHHIVPDSEGGCGEYDNGIPVCLDCHAEIESKSNMGRRFTADELKMQRDRWMATVREHPDVLVRAAQALTATGPLEALFSVMEYNRTAIIGGVDEPYPPLTVRQFERVIGTNALAALDEVTRDPDSTDVRGHLAAELSLRRTAADATPKRSRVHIDGRCPKRPEDESSAVPCGCHVSAGAGTALGRLRAASLGMSVTKRYDSTVYLYL